MSPMPGTWQTPPGSGGAAGVRFAVSVTGESAARTAGADRAVDAAADSWAAWVAWVAASAGVEIVSNATASSSTLITQREMRRPGGGASAWSRRGNPAGSGEAGEIAIFRELLVLRLRRRFRRSPQTC